MTKCPKGYRQDWVIELLRPNIKILKYIFERTINMKPLVLIDIHKSKVKRVLLKMKRSRSLNIIFYFIYIM